MEPNEDGVAEGVMMESTRKAQIVFPSIGLLEVFQTGLELLIYFVYFCVHITAPHRWRGRNMPED